MAPPDSMPFMPARTSSVRRTGNRAEVGRARAGQTLPRAELKITLGGTMEVICCISQRHEARRTE